MQLGDQRGLAIQEHLQARIVHRDQLAGLVERVEEGAILGDQIPANAALLIDVVGQEHGRCGRGGIQSVAPFGGGMVGPDRGVNRYPEGGDAHDQSQCRHRPDTPAQTRRLGHGDSLRSPKPLPPRCRAHRIVTQRDDGMARSRALGRPAEPPGGACHPPARPGPDPIRWLDHD